MQMWFNEDMPEEIAGCIASVKKFTEGEYYFIGYPQNAPRGAIILDPVSEIDKAWDFLGNVAWWRRHCTHLMFVSEMVRFAWALRVPDLIYADADVEMLSMLDVYDDSKPHFPLIPNGYDLGFFYSGNKTWWERFMSLTMQRNDHRPFAFVHTLREIYLTELMSKPVTIPSAVCKHHYRNQMISVLAKKDLL